MRASLICVLALGTMSLAFGQDHKTYKFSPSVIKELANVPDVEGRIKILANILDDKASHQNDKLAAFAELGRLNTSASADVLANHLTFHYTSEEFSEKVIYTPAKDALVSMGETAIDPLLKFIELHAPDNRVEYNPVRLAVDAIADIKGGQKGFEDFEVEYAASGLRSVEVLKALHEHVYY